MISEDFSLAPGDLAAFGAGLSRPECVLTTERGELYVSDARGGVTRIAPDGSGRLFAGRIDAERTLAANGFALMADGSFLIAPLAGGGVFRLRRDGQAAPFLLEVDGHDLDCPNFVLLDHVGRVWICALTRQDRRTLTRYHRDWRDGFIVLVERGAARIVADGIGYPNELRVTPDGRWLYTNETLAGRLLRYAIGPDGRLSGPEVVAELDDSNMLDGFTLDSTGGAWLTALVSNRLWHVPQGGAPRVVLEEQDPVQLARLVAMQRSATGVERDVLYQTRAGRLRNISSIGFGGADLRTAYLGSLMGDELLHFRAPVAGIAPAHWRFGPFD